MRAKDLVFNSTKTYNPDEDDYILPISDLNTKGVSWEEANELYGSNDPIDNTKGIRAFNTTYFEPICRKCYRKFKCKMYESKYGVIIKTCNYFKTYVEIRL